MLTTEKDAVRLPGYREPGAGGQRPGLSLPLYVAVIDFTPLTAADQAAVSAVLARL